MLKNVSVQDEMKTRNDKGKPYWDKMKWGMKPGTYSTRALDDKGKENMWEGDLSKSLSKRWASSIQTLWKKYYLSFETFILKWPF